jgi:Ca2+-transporting ATPase
VIGVLRGERLWLMVETGIALAIAAVPEGLPVVATVTLAVGMHRMARRRALIRRLPSVETLGSATVVCTDKTGTLTAGKMAVDRILVAGRTVTAAAYGSGPALTIDGREVGIEEVPGLREVLATGVLANRAAVDDRGAVQGDPTETALLAAGRAAGLDRDALLAEAPEIHEVPFSSERMLMATFHRQPDGGVVARVKGAPARLVELSDQVLTRDGEAALDRRRRLEILDANRALAGDGLRILGLARKTLEAGEDPGEDAVCGLTFLGLVAISDPPAPGVAETIAVLHGAGVRTVMLTGDQRATAESVARALGILREGDEVVEGRQLTSSGADELASRVDRTGAFCRVGPEHKLHIVEAFQQRGEIVAMLGDGVNDAPALERADIGVAMGGRGTDVAKEAADLVLADDRFQTIAAALQEGRVILDNIRKFIFYLFSCNLSEVLVLLLSVVAGLPLPLLPLQILWLNMVTDVFPALALGMEPAEPDVMRRPPRDPQAEILSRRFLVEVAAYGLLLTAVTLGAFLWADRGRGLELDRARTVAFMTLALTQLFHVFNARSRRPVLFGRRLLGNRWVLAAFALTVALQLAVVYLPPLSGLFQTVPLTAADWLLVLPAAVAPLVFGQLAKARRP